MIRTYLCDPRAILAVFLLLLTSTLEAQYLNPLTPIAPGRTALTGQIIPDDLYIFGGIDSAGNYLNTTQHLPYCNGCPWVNLAPMPTPRAFAASSRLPNGNIIVIGGQNSTGYVGAVEEYNPTSNTWFVHSSIPPFAHADAILVGGYVHFIGGYDGTTVSNYHLLYNPASLSWSFVGFLPVGLMDHQIAHLEIGGVDHIYIAGGRTAPSNPTAISGAMYDYSSASGTYTPLPPMATPRAGFGIGSENSFFKRIYVYGGHTNTGGMTSTVETFETSFNTWGYEQPMSAPRADFWGDGFWDRLTNCAYRVVAIGGVNSAGLVSTLAEAYYLQSGPFDISDLEFSGVSSSQGIDLDWALNVEGELSHFTLSHSHDSEHFEELAAEILAEGNEAWNYHHAISHSGMQFYRLQAYGINGELQYTRNLTVLNTAEKANTFQLFPNPAVDRVQFAFAEAEGERQVTLFTTEGKAVHESMVGSLSGWELQVEELPRGLYLVQVKDGLSVQYQRVVLK